MKRAKSKFVHDQAEQDFYDSFNKFIFSSDTKVFGKLASKIFFLEQTKSIPGDIVELGVFKGSGLIAWLKSAKVLGLNTVKVVGFDIFDEANLIKDIKSQDRNLMKELFETRLFKSLGHDKLLESILKSNGFINFELVKGDVKSSVPKFLESYPGFRAKLINFDLDTEEPTDICLRLLWDRLLPGGIMLFDEYAIKEWTESNAVDKFVREKNLALRNTTFEFPTAFIIK